LRRAHACRPGLLPMETNVGMHLLGVPKLDRERSDLSTWDWAESGWEEVRVFNQADRNATRVLETWCTSVAVFCQAFAARAISVAAQREYLLRGIPVQKRPRHAQVSASRGEIYERMVRRSLAHTRVPLRCGRLSLYCMSALAEEGRRMHMAVRSAAWGCRTRNPKELSGCQERKNFLIGAQGA